MKTFSRAEVASHATPSDCWCVIHDQVYDVSKYLNKHPGGGKLIFRNAGRDLTKDFEAMYHSAKARSILEQFLIGKVEGTRKREALSVQQPMLVSKGYGQVKSARAGTSIRFGGKKLAHTKVPLPAVPKFGTEQVTPTGINSLLGMKNSSNKTSGNSLSISLSSPSGPSPANSSQAAPRPGAVWFD